MDFIFIRELRLDAWVGLHKHEKIAPQTIELDIEIGIPGDTVFASGKVADTIDYSVVVETVDAGSAQTLAFNITGGLSTGTVHVWKTDVNSQFVQQSDITPSGGSFTITFAPGSIYSLTTTSGQAKGTAAPPSSSAFPFPYSDDFDSYALSQEAKYFSALNGSFEIANCGGGRSGFCLRQAVTTPPIPWHSIGPIEPIAVMGLGPYAGQSRSVLTALGSRLVYGWLDKPAAPGQPSAAEVRKMVRSVRKLEN